MNGVRIKAMEQEIESFIQEVCEEQPYKLVLSQPKEKESEVRRIVIQQFQGKQKRQYQIEKFTDKQAFHINIEETDLYASIQTYFGNAYCQITAWTKDWAYQGKISKKGKLLHNRRRNTQDAVILQGVNKKKQYCIPEGTVIPPLVDMGIFTKDGKVVHAKYDKYKQINRFLELVEDVLKEFPESGEQPISIIDFGCGKSYLTFLLYYYLVEMCHRNVKITGLDLKPTVIEHCRETAQKYHYKNMKFEIGDIQGYRTTEPVDIVITLHACDTATDYALYHAIQWNAKVILSVPCCQHEWNQQMKKDALPILTRYGIIKERAAALMTDAVRGNLLEASGYHTQVMEFVDMEHSPKNLLIRAVKRNVSEEKKKAAWQEAEELITMFGVNPKLYQLLSGETWNE